MKTQAPSRIVMLSDEINEITAEKVIKAILLINDYDADREATTVGYERKPIRLIVNTPGGFMTDKSAIISAITSSKTEIHALVFGLCASAGIYIVAACNKRIGTQFSRFMIHDCSSEGSQTRISWKEYITFLDEEMDSGINFLTSRTSITREQLEAVYNAKRDWWFNSTEALSLGLIDEVI